uniref:Uncharacterized protein n=1 Tax=Cacopsylla melanoneura TaxID=428564 RepID=A0A8D8RFR1_9HEMI
MSGSDLLNMECMPVESFFGISVLSNSTAFSSHAQACIFLYESRPFSVNLSQGFGLDSSSETVPWESPRIYLANSLWPTLCTESSSRTRREMYRVSKLCVEYLSML